MMESYPIFLSTSSSSNSIPLHQMLIHGSNFRHAPVSDGVMSFPDVSGNDMSIDETSGMKNDVVSLSKSFHVDESTRIGVDGMEKKNVVGAGVATTTMAGTGAGRGDYDKKKKMRGQRFAFQTRSQVDILDDGYRWRKYGQKAVKNNKFPRSYYKCTQQGCKVKKQVQRLSRDEGVVVTTYEGIHSHPIHKSIDNFEHILTQMQICNSYN